MNFEITNKDLATLIAPESPLSNHSVRFFDHKNVVYRSEGFIGNPSIEIVAGEYRRAALALLRAIRDGETTNWRQIMNSISIWAQDLAEQGETVVSKRLAALSNIPLARHELQERMFCFRCGLLPMARQDRDYPPMITAVREEHAVIREIRRRAYPNRY